MRKLIATTAFSLALPFGGAQANVNDDRVLQEIVMLSIAATAVTTGCKSYKMSVAGTQVMADDLLAHAAEQGYGAADLAAIQEPQYLLAANEAAVAYLAESGVDINDEKALCAYAKKTLRDDEHPLSALIEKK